MLPRGLPGPGSTLWTTKTACSCERHSFLAPLRLRCVADVRCSSGRPPPPQPRTPSLHPPHPTPLPALPACRTWRTRCAPSWRGTPGLAPPAAPPTPLWWVTMQGRLPTQQTCCWTRTRRARASPFLLLAVRCPPPPLVLAPAPALRAPFGCAWHCILALSPTHPLPPLTHPPTTPTNPPTHYPY